MKLLNLKEEIKEILEELENMYEISELEEQVNNINKIRDYIINLQQKNKQLKEQLLATQTNEETFRLEMEDITRILGLDEDTIFDDVKTYARSLKENKILRENAEHNDKVVDKVNCKNMLLKKKYEQLKKQVDEYKKLGFKYLQDKNNKLENQQKEFINYLEDEKDRLARECSNIYEDSLGHTRLVNADMFDEANDILQKYRSIIGCDKVE